MNKVLLKAKAIELEKLLLKCSETDDEASDLFRVLSLLIENSKSMMLESPLEWRDIPGAIFFSEGSLAKFSDLEKAFSEFRIELTGGEPLALRRLRGRQH